MFFTGIADEASPRLERQIQAHLDLGWKHVECRNVDGRNLTDIDDAAFDRVVAQLETASLQVSCFASQLANWARPIDSDFAVDVSEMRRAIPRMARLKTPFLRCMSYPNAKSPVPAAEWRREAARRLKVLSAMARDAGITLVHENCSGWGGQGPRQTLDLLSDVGSPHLKLVFDTGNPVEYRQDAWTYYEAVRDHVVYVHIKDYRTGPDGKGAAVHAGDGEGAVRRIVSDLLARGYDGGFSIEPHLTSIIHLRQDALDPELAYRTYVEYGRRFEALLREITDSR